MNRIAQLSTCVLTGCLLISGCQRVSAKTEDQAANGVPVRAVRADVRDVPFEIAAVGTVEAIHSVSVRARVTGPIARVAFTEGQNVTKGQLLFTIDRVALDRQAAEQKAAEERDAAMEEQARAVLARDAASEKQSRSEAGIAVKLGELGVISGQRVNQLTTAQDTASAGLAADKASLAAAEATLKGDRARLAELELQQSLTSVDAPISGRAGAVLVKEGNLVNGADTTLVTLLQLAPIYATFSVPQQSLPEIQRLNAQGALAVEATDDQGVHATGRLAFIDNTVDTNTGAIQLKAAFANTGNGLWPGEFVHVRLRLRLEKAKTVVPDACIEDGLDGKYAWVIHDGRAAMTPVSVERVYAPQDAQGMAVITSGLRRGDLVVTEGQLRLTAGARVALLGNQGS
ncbi:efflux RND transporter periplasmic adaptor subunit [Silvibacterium acidisoli]|uniref:efflux RND transporter periplasmic adaptor subunit n=1 Tax=Acidobacteriaceae bacterium ZG23-2 TaxID=2883246 RepID=UPI00406C1F52